MRTAHILAVAVAMTGSLLLSLPASAAEVCDRNCVGPLCGEDCTRTPDATVGKGVREPDVTIEERRRVREPDVEIRRDRLPGVEVEIKREWTGASCPRAGPFSLLWPTEAKAA